MGWGRGSGWRDAAGQNRLRGQHGEENDTGSLPGSYPDTVAVELLVEFFCWSHRESQRKGDGSEGTAERGDRELGSMV